MAVRYGVAKGDVGDLGLRGDGVGCCEVYLEGHGDEGVGE